MTSHADFEYSEEPVVVSGKLVTRSVVDLFSQTPEADRIITVVVVRVSNGVLEFMHLDPIVLASVKTSHLPLLTTSDR